MNDAVVTLLDGRSPVRLRLKQIEGSGADLYQPHVQRSAMRGQAERGLQWHAIEPPQKSNSKYIQFQGYLNCFLKFEHVQFEKYYFNI